MPQARFGDGLLGQSRSSATIRHIGAMLQAGIRAHSGTVRRLVSPVDLARFDSKVKLPDGRLRQDVAAPRPAAFLCARYATVRA